MYKEAVEKFGITPENAKCGQSSTKKHFFVLQKFSFQITNCCCNSKFKISFFIKNFSYFF